MGRRDSQETHPYWKDPDDGNEAAELPFLQQVRRLLIFLGGSTLLLACMLGIPLAVTLTQGPSPHTTPTQSANYIRGLCIAIGIVLAVSGAAFWGGFKGVQDHRKYLTRFSAWSLPKRAARAAEALQEATRLVEDLKNELDARAVLLAEIRRQATEEQQRVDDIIRLAQIDAVTVASVNRQYDELLERRLTTLEHGARRREWLLATVVAGIIGLIVGVLAILLAQHLSL